MCTYILSAWYSMAPRETWEYDLRLIWPDTLSLATDGYLYVTANQLHRQARYNNGKISELNLMLYSVFK